ncbi:FAD-binding oxidoreductase [Rhodococcus coprophilus]|uniref:FAD-linked oxidase n=1 Tax=Rhodococcus coprophilus TaxID=38310 RepID=A0A2X4WWX6_9NOCA|nr:FAD-binding oxidoreductase [Rhodococcus coprophilus]SQI28584.1 FAD-linked oxidase [Rhodococcus coprophilus]
MPSLEDVLPPGRVVRDPAILVAYQHDQEHAPWSEPAALVRPINTDEVAVAIAWANATGTPVVPRGAGTGLSGGANAVPGSVVLCVEQMNRILEIDPVERLAVVQPGVLNEQLRAAAAEVGLWYPPDPSSREMCSLGGNVATNAGGLCCVRYGVTRDYVLALEVVTGAGQVLRLGSRTAKNAVGYHLTGLFVGSEGTLGVVTEITLRLRQGQPPLTTIIGAFESTAMAASAAVATMRADGVNVEICELMDEATFTAVDALMPLELPDEVASLVLLQVTEEAAAAQAVAALEAAGALWAHRSESPQESALLIEARRRAFEAVSRLGTVTTEDVCVPVGQVGPVLTEIESIATTHGVPIATVAHVGDGNLHPMLIDDGSLSQATVRAVFDAILAVAVAAGGTVTGEHGVGLLKRDAAIGQLGDAVVELNSQVKSVFDPNHIMNPGKIAVRAMPQEALI